MSAFALETRALAKRYGGLSVTNEVSLALPQGARHALIGPNGAGKTTLVGLISGVIRPDAGAVLMFGREVTKAGPARRVRLGLARTFQITSLFARLTVLENLYLAVSEQRGDGFRFLGSAAGRGATLARCEALLDQFRLAPYAHRTAGELAYGLQRLVELALALALEPRILLLDEPAAGIPSSESGLLIEAVEALPSDITILLIEHDMALVRRLARDATLLVHGAVAARGTVAELMGSDVVRRVYLGAMAGGTTRHA